MTTLLLSEPTPIDNQNGNYIGNIEIDLKSLTVMNDNDVLLYKQTGANGLPSWEGGPLVHTTIDTPTIVCGSSTEAGTVTVGNDTQAALSQLLLVGPQVSLQVGDSITTTQGNCNMTIGDPSGVGAEGNLLVNGTSNFQSSSFLWTNDNIGSSIIAASWTNGDPGGGIVASDLRFWTKDWAMFVVTVPAATTVAANTDCQFTITWDGTTVPAGTTGYFPLIEQGPNTTADAVLGYAGVNQVRNGVASPSTYPGAFLYHVDKASSITPTAGVYSDISLICHVTPSAEMQPGTYTFFVRMNWLY
jgi:hypothetical protein